ncbi:hypothetical protein FHW36_106441 [Chitinophaga polysaccharea]|uniref:Uncharacterized protein n=1 Tax=Chitinophaga polysaccharea TaxID=1293035 RepID=A0A561PM75_9BACT|nr:hypothetical protein [Chitinophaga polysaccharea]TWF39209.1 hypothetical protein FHW36_106441 [Chitinophaga polysaccharea]
MRNILLSGLLLIAVGMQACKKEKIVIGQSGKEIPDISINTLKEFVAQKNSLSVSDVKYDEKHGYFSIYNVNTIKFETALSDFINSKQLENENK